MDGTMPNMVLCKALRELFDAQALPILRRAVLSRRNIDAMQMRSTSQNNAHGAWILELDRILCLPQR
ncbi:hypothetical protein PSPO01_09099 [Paraphaeosphaeria sporulosa]